MTSLFRSALQSFDAGLENVGLLADAATRSGQYTGIIRSLL